MNFIVVLNLCIVALCAYSLFTAFRSGSRFPRLRIPFLFIFSAFVITLLVALSNILQRSAGFVVFDQIEEYFEVLILPFFLIFAFSWSSAKQLECSQSRLALLHHRVKNGLQIIESLLGTQADSVDSASARSALDDARWRIAAIGAAERMSLESGEPETVDMREYLLSISENMEMNVNIEAEDLQFDSSAAADCGLFTTEYLLMLRSMQSRQNMSMDRIPTLKLTRKGDDRCVLSFDTALGDIPLFSRTMFEAMARQLHGTITIDDSSRISIDFLRPGRASS